MSNPDLIEKSFELNKQYRHFIGLWMSTPRNQSWIVKQDILKPTMLIIRVLLLHKTERSIYHFRGNTRRVVIWRNKYNGEKREIGSNKAPANSHVGLTFNTANAQISTLKGDMLIESTSMSAIINSLYTLLWYRCVEFQIYSWT